MKINILKNEKKFIVNINRSIGIAGNAVFSQQSAVNSIEMINKQQSPCTGKNYQ